MALNNIPRISAPDSVGFLHEYIFPGRPIVIADLFDESPIRAIDTVERACDDLGGVELLIQPNYMTFLDGKPPRPPRPLRLAEYAEHVARSPATRDLCVEYPTPEAIAKLFVKPPYCALRDAADVISATFVANPGNYNHLHFDDDQRDVLLYQVFGTKRFIVIDPDQGRKLDPFLVFDQPTANALASIPSRDASGRVFFENFPSEEARDAFLRYVHASETVLHPGETIFIPALHWHYVEYVDFSMSVTCRLGRNRYNRAFARRFPQPSIFVQSVGAKLVDEERARTNPLVDELYTACQRQIARPSDDRAIYRLIARLFEAMYGESVAGVAAARALYHQALKGQLASQG
jgi:hypothetical protein